MTKLIQREEKQFHQNGFTSVEMMMALVASAIVLIGIAVIVAGSHKYIINGRTKSRLQQDFSLVEQVLSKKIRGSIKSRQEIYTDYASYTGGGSTQSSGSCIKLYYPSGDSVVIYKDGKDFRILNADLSTTNLVQGVVNSLVFSDQTKSIQTAMSFVSGKWSVVDTPVVTFRNFNEEEEEPDWPYAVFAGDDIQFYSGSGTITGDIHANEDVWTVLGGYTVTGNITETTPSITLPTVDWSFFENAAIAAGQKVSGDKTFDSSASPYSGVWYITGDAKIEDNTVINGTIVTEDDVEFKGDNVTIKASPSNYPAILVMDDVKKEDRDLIQITGFIYCGDKWRADGENWTVIGALVAVDDVELRVNNTTITFTANYVNDLNGVTFP